jgi:succinoglycan biosynthesis protein ExoM
MLKGLLEHLAIQDTGGIYDFDIVVVDNDAERSAEQAVNEAALTMPVKVRYFLEEKQNTAMARQRAVSNAHGDFIAFIDDDEIPADTGWIRNMIETVERFGVDGALGPVRPLYKEQPPQWVLKGRFHERPEHDTGHLLKWTQTRTGNALVKRKAFETVGFNPEYGCDGEDRDFFRRAIDSGCKFVWCGHAPVLESVSPIRWNRRFMLRRALMRGRKPSFRRKDILISITAVIIYGISLPVLFLSGHHIFMKYLIKTFDHLGRILYAAGIDVIKEAYVTEQ